MTLAKTGTERSGLHNIQQLATLIHQPVTPAGAAGASGGGAIGVGLVVLLLIALPVAGLILPLDDDAGHDVLDGLTEISVRGVESFSGNLVRMTLKPATGQGVTRVACIENALTNNLRTVNQNVNTPDRRTPYHSHTEQNRA